MAKQRIAAREAKEAARKAQEALEATHIENYLAEAQCEEDTILVAIVSEYYRCTNCGSDTRQHINGKIRYIKLSESDKKFIKQQNGQSG
jgi:Zn finger protein HypA/HybF involved in hydrogenase expression